MDSISSNNKHSYQIITKNPIEAQLPNQNNFTLSQEIDEDCFEGLNKKADNTMKKIFVRINKQISALQTVEMKLNASFHRPSYCEILLSKGLLKIEEYKDVLIQLKSSVKCVTSIDDFPLPLMEIIMMIENVEAEVEFLEKLNEVLSLENEVKNHWLTIITENSEKPNNLNSEINRKRKDIEGWCSQHKNKDDSNIINLKNGLMQISKLIQNNFEFKRFFRVKWYTLEIYCVEPSKKLTFQILSENLAWFYIYAHNAIEIPNYKLFCLLEFKNACIIDLKTMSIIKTLPASYGASQFSFVYYLNCVYVLSSASHDSRSIFLKKYDLSNNRKIFLPKPNINYINASCDFNCAIYRGSILFCAKDSFDLYKFDLEIRSYSKLPAFGLNSFSIKVLLIKNERAYAIDFESGIFESEIDNEYAWSKLCKFQNNNFGEDLNISPDYFSVMESSSLQVYKFDLGSRRVEKVEYD